LYSIILLFHEHYDIYYNHGYQFHNFSILTWFCKEWRNRIELIQDFEFPEASYRIKVTRDGKYAVASGIYKPQFRVYEFSEMSMKFDRHSDVENVNFTILSDDWSKSVHLQADRSLEFHTQFGMHYSTRIPKFGRDLNYHYPSCDLLVSAAGNEVYRLNLELGQFLNPLVTDSPGVNKVAINPASQLWGFGGEDGHVEFWDPRIRTRIARVDMLPFIRQNLEHGQQVPEVTEVSFRNDGLHVGVGTSTGQVLLFDLRHPMPRMIKDHQYGTEIKHIHFHDLSGNIVSADNKIIRVWNRENGTMFTSIEPPNPINDICVVPDTGMVFVAGEAVQMHTYLVPEMGPSPKFASFLDTLTEEMAETSTSVLYDNFKFVTRKELKKLGLENVVGTTAAKAYMHGYFIDQRLYERAKLIANPFAFDEFKKKLVREKLDAKRSSRITQTGAAAKASIAKSVKVNQNLAKKIGGIEQLDDRFKDVFSNTEFEVDETSEAFKLINPSTKPTSDRRNVYESSDDEGAITLNSKVQEDLVGDSSSESNDDTDVGITVEYPQLPKKKMKSISEPIIPAIPSPSIIHKKSQKAPKNLKMEEIKTDSSLKKRQTFASRLESEVGKVMDHSRIATGAMEMSIIMGTKGKKGPNARRKYSK
jgi:ribosome biogenesis protein ENP2